MDLFLDSNVIIGYSLYLDPWHKYAENVFEKENKSYWSKTVKKESENKIIEKMNIYNSFFIELKSNLQKINDNFGKCIISKEEFFSTLLKTQNKKISIQNKRKIGESIWNEGSWYDEANTQELLKTISKIKIILNSTSEVNYNHCLENLILHYRNKQYESILESFNNLNVRNSYIFLHYPDNIIILDAHDLACSGIDLEFITGDKKLLKFKKSILDLTNINQMTFLGDVN